MSASKLSTTTWIRPESLPDIPCNAGDVAAATAANFLNLRKKDGKDQESILSSTTPDQKLNIRAWNSLFTHFTD